MTVFIFSVVLLAVLGILIGILLGVAGKVFAVETDERVEKVRECLPGNNCCLLYTSPSPRDSH